jgi:hypothetical protein
MNSIKSIPESGIYIPNNFARMFMLSLEEVMGVNGLNAILNEAGQSALIGNYPPNDLDYEFDISYFSAIAGALEELYGLRGARVFAVRAGTATFKQILMDTSEPVDVNSESYQSKPLVEKISFGLSVIRDTFSNTKDTAIPRTEEGSFLYSVQYCPVCWGRKTSVPSCYLISGLLQASIRWSTNGKEVVIEQTKAHSCGDATCDFIIPIS